MRAINIPFNRFMEMAVQAGHVNEGPFGESKHINLTDQLNYIKFAHAIAVANDLKPVTSILIETIVQMAKDHGGYAPRGWETLSGEAMTTQMLWESQTELFYVRYAHLIAAELAS